MAETDGRAPAQPEEGSFPPPRPKISALRVAAVIAGVAAFFIALTAQGAKTPDKTAEAARQANEVTAAVRNGLGQLKWVQTSATDYTPLEAEGRRIYVQARCWYCHSQYSEPKADPANRWSPISADKRRWGPAVEPSEYSYDHPVLFGTKGIAPDLAREGLKYSEEWHLAHFYNPPMLVKGSIMGGFSGLFDTVEAVKIVNGADGGKTLERTPGTEKISIATNR